MVARVHFDTRSADDYRRFLAIRRLPLYRFCGTSAEVPDEYMAQIGLDKKRVKRSRKYEPTDGMFDYQRDITELAIQRQKYAIFADCGLGKTLMLLEFARHVATVNRGGRVLIVSPLMVVSQTLDEARRWYGERFSIGQVRAFDLQYWLDSGDCNDTQIGVTNDTRIQTRRQGATKSHRPDRQASRQK